VKILILTQYFPPEVGAPQNRLYELAIRLKEKGAQITILTAMPNYPEMQIHQEYRGKWYVREKLNGLDVIRSYIFVSKKTSLIVRMIIYFSFVFSSLIVGLFKLRKLDFIICESPPLFLGISAYLIKALKKAKLIFNISDLWPESAEQLGLVTNKFILRMATKLEEFLYRKSALITGQTPGIVNDISHRFPDKNVYWLKNGVDAKLFNPEIDNSEWRQKNGFNENDLLLLYAGIIGYAQGLEVILHAANELRKYEDIKFILLGSGPEKEKLIGINKKLGLENVKFIDIQPKEMMPVIISAVDVAIIPLKRLELFKGAIPSKIFETLAMKKPILLGVEGEAKELFIDQGQCGLSFDPENFKDLSRKVQQLYTNRDLIKEYGENGLKYVTENFNIDTIARDFWDVLLQNRVK